MAMFQDRGVVLGEFQEKEFGKYFEFRLAEPDSWGAIASFPYCIAVGCLGETRYAKVLKTVAYVVVDQDSNGDPIVEKWSIKLLWKQDLTVRNKTAMMTPS